MRRSVLIVLAFLLVPIGIVAYQVAIPPDEDQQLIDYAFPPVSLTANGAVLPAWRKPISVLVITDEMGGNSLSRLLVDVLDDFAKPSTLEIAQINLTTSNVGAGKDKLIICVCGDIISAARRQLSESLAYQMPNDIEREQLLKQYEDEGSHAFVTLRASTKTREVESATVYLASNASSATAEQAISSVVTALSPQLGYKERARKLFKNDFGLMGLNAFGKRYLSLMLDSRVFPNMSRSAFEALVRSNP